MRRFSVLILLAFFLVINGFGQSAVQWRGVNRDGIYAESGLLKTWPASGPKLLWHFDNLGEGHGSASVAGNKLYLTGEMATIGYVFCLSSDGKLLWKTPYGVEWTESWPGARITPLFADGKLYLMSAFGVVVCLNAEKGNVLWKVDLLKEYDGRNIVWGMTENLLIDGNKLFCTPGGVNANVIALDKNNGKLIWKSTGNGDKSAYCSPMIARLPKGKVLVTFTEKSIICLDVESGKKLWSHPQTNQYSVHANTPLYSNGMLYCMSGYGAGGLMFKLSEDGSKADVVWKNATLDSRMGGFVLLNGKIYGIGDKNKGLHCIDWKTGSLVKTDSRINKLGSVISDGAMIYTYDENGDVTLWMPSASGPVKVTSFKVPYGSAQHWSHPVIDKGRLFVRHGNSLMVYSIKAT